MLRVDAWLEQFRVLTGPLQSSPNDGPNGAFQTPKIRIGKTVSGRRFFSLILSEANADIPWEHASISTAMRCPNWIEMNWWKERLWEPDDVVIQIHPAKQNYINCHPFCLHLWRPTSFELPLPPTIAIGPRSEAWK